VAVSDIAAAAPRETETDSTWHVYVVRSRDGSLYTGIATDVGRRLAEHEGGKGAKYLRGRGPFRLVFERRIGSHALALKVERGLKELPKQEKEQLVEAAPDAPRLLEMLAIG
jgi:putative endonuclease